MSNKQDHSATCFSLAVAFRASLIHSATLTLLIQCAHRNVPHNAALKKRIQLASTTRLFLKPLKWSTCVHLKSLECVHTARQHRLHGCQTCFSAALNDILDELSKELEQKVDRNANVQITKFSLASPELRDIASKFRDREVPDETTRRLRGFGDLDTRKRVDVRCLIGGISARSLCRREVLDLMSISKTRKHIQDMKFLDIVVEIMMGWGETSKTQCSSKNNVICIQDIPRCESSCSRAFVAATAPSVK